MARGGFNGEAANSAAISAIPGVAFSGARTGLLYALSAADGHSLWEFDTAKDFETVNKVAAHGGTMASAGPTVAGGTLFVASGYSFGGGGDKMGNVLLAFSPEWERGIQLDHATGLFAPELALAIQTPDAADKDTARVL